MKKKTKWQRYAGPAGYALLFLAFVLGSIEGSSYFMNRAGLTRDVPLFSLEFGDEVTAPGPRRSIAPRGNDVSKHLVVFGGNTAWGRGADDWSTIPSRLATRFSDHRVYNLALPNGKPTAQLRQVKNRALDAVLEPKGFAVYVITDEDVLRTRLDSSWSARAAREFALRTQTGKLLGLSWPLKFTAADFEKTAALVEEIKNEYLTSFPDGKFAVVFYPGTSKNAAGMRPLLRKKGIHSFDYSHKVLVRRARFSAAENYAFDAEIIAGDLKDWTKVESQIR